MKSILIQILQKSFVSTLTRFHVAALAFPLEANNKKASWRVVTGGGMKTWATNIEISLYREGVLGEDVMQENLSYRDNFRS